MLETHRTDLRIIEAIKEHRFGGTVIEIHDGVCSQDDGQISLDAIKRHLPGLVRLGAIRGVKEFRGERLVTVWRLRDDFFEQNRRTRTEAENA